MASGRMERVIESALTAGLLASATLLLLGLELGVPGALRGGIVLLLFTPVARVIVSTVGLFLARDWVFGAVSLFVLLVLASGIFVATRLPRPAPPAATAPR